MKYLFLILLDFLIVGFFAYTQLLPHKDKLDPKHRKWFDIGDSIFGALTKMTSNMAKPYPAGPEFKLDLGPLILVAILTFANILFFIR